VHFAWIAAAGGISAASREHEVAKATLSRSLARLEQIAGAPLFERHARGLRPTELGRELQPAARACEAALRDADAALRSMNAVPEGHLRISVSALLGERMLGPALADFHRRYPAVRPELRVSHTALDPVREGLDLTIQLSRPTQSELVVRRLLSLPMHLYASTSLVAELSLDVEDPEAVTALERVIIDTPLLAADWLLSGPGGATLRLARPPALSVGEPLTALAVVRRGVGITLLPAFLVEARARPGELLRLLPAWRGESVELFAVMPPGRKRVAAVRAFLDHLVGWIAAAPGLG